MTVRSDRLLQQLRATVDNAVRAPYYARVFGSHARKLRQLADFQRLPLLDKLTAIAHQRDLIVGEPPPGFGVASSGTTRRDVDLPPLNVLHSPEEGKAACAALPSPSAPEDDPYPGWTLVSLSVVHGVPAEPPGPDELFVPWLYDRNALYMLETVLRDPQPDGRRVTAMRISVGALKVFTAWLLERGKDPAAFGIKLIGTNSFRLSPFWRELIETRFGARIFDNYSLSEFATPATECEHCGELHFAWPPVHYEVLDLGSGRPLQRGAGRLVLTGLYPFVQKMPLVRYDTGDVVEFGRRCPATGEQGLIFCGRVRRGLVVKAGRQALFVLAPTRVQDVLEALPETARTPHPMATLGVIKTRDLGLPRWTVTLEPGRPAVAHLRFEVRFDPHVFVDAAERLAAAVRAELTRTDSALRGLLRRRRLRLLVTAVGEGQLTPPPDKHD